MYLCKLSDDHWLNLAQIRSVEVEYPPKNASLKVTWIMAIALFIETKMQRSCWKPGLGYIAAPKFSRVKYLRLTS